MNESGTGKKWSGTEGEREGSRMGTVWKKNGRGRNVKLNKPLKNGKGIGNDMK